MISTGSKAELSIAWHYEGGKRDDDRDIVASLTGANPSDRF
jgi:hypothetical protein